jgi:hypothetical protein
VEVTPADPITNDTNPLNIVENGFNSRSDKVSTLTLLINSIVIELGYDEDDWYKNDADQRELSSMNEMMREGELEERRNHVNRLKYKFSELAKAHFA